MQEEIPAHLRRPKNRHGVEFPACDPKTEPKSAIKKQRKTTADDELLADEIEALETYRKYRERLGAFRRSETKDDGDGKKKEGLHFYARKVAKELNPQQPDITAAVILYNLWLWQDNKYKQTLIKGKRYCFRSLTKLAEDHPYFTKSAIHKAIQRIEKHYGSDFIVKRDKKELWFSIDTKIGLLMGQGARNQGIEFDTRTGKKLIRKYPQGENLNKLNRFYWEDAKKLKSVRASVILANLKYALSVFTDPKTDELGNKYAELSPKKLCPILEYSEDTITRCIQDLIEHDLIICHKKHRTFYALKDGYIESVEAVKTSNTKSAEVHNEPAERNTRPAEVHNEPAEVHSGASEIALEPLKYKASSVNDQVTYSNSDSNSDCNECFKGCLPVTLSASPPCQPHISSKGLRILHELSKAKLQEFKMSKRHPVKVTKVPASLLPYDIIVGLDDYTPQQSINDWIDEQVQEMKSMFKIVNAKCDKEDLEMMRRLFADNLQLSADDLKNYYPPWTQVNVIGGDLTNESVKSKRRTKSKVKDLLAKAPSRNRIWNKVKTAKAFLRYLPQLIAVESGVVDFGDQTPSEHKSSDAFNSIDLSCLGNSSRSKLIPSEWKQVTKVEVDHEANPIK